VYAGLRVVPILGERMSSPSSSANHAQWEALVGRAILCFGDIELISIKCLALIPSDKIGDSAARMDFYRRAELLIEILEARPERDANLNAILLGIKRAKVLAKTRNLIAHNPVMMNLYVNDDETEAFAQHAISSARAGNQTLDLDDLKEFAAEVEDLSSTLWLTFMKLTGASDHLWRVRSEERRDE